MTIYNVHIYREMRLVFGGIEAGSPEAAAAIARDKLTSDADSIDDCDGETFAALVDVAGDEEYEQSRTIDFEPERQRKAAPALLAALKGVLGESDYDAEGCCRGCGREREDEAYKDCAIDDDVEDCPFGFARAVIAQAEAACPPSSATGTDDASGAAHE